MVLKIIAGKGGLYYADQIHRCYVRPCQTPEIQVEAKVLNEQSGGMLKLLTYRTFADNLAIEHTVLFNVEAYLMDDAGTTIEKL